MNTSDLITEIDARDRPTPTSTLAALWNQQRRNTKAKAQAECSNASTNQRGSKEEMEGAEESGEAVGFLCPRQTDQVLPLTR